MGLAENAPSFRADLIIEQVKYTTQDGLFTLSSDSVKWTKDSLIDCVIFGFNLASNLNDEAFHRKRGYLSAKPRICIEQIKLPGLSLTDGSGIACSKAEISRYDVYLHRNHRYELPERITPFPQEMLRALSVPIKHNTLNLSYGRLEISIVGHLSNKEASIVIDNLQIGVFNVSNLTTAHAPIQAKAKGTLNGKGSIELDVKYFQNGKDCPLQLKALANDVALNHFSDLVEQETNLKLISGKVNRLSYYLNGNKYKADCSLSADYDHLGLDLTLEAKSKQKKWKTKLEKALKKALLRKENHRNTGIRSVNNQIERDGPKAFPGQWIDGLLWGMAQSTVKIDLEKVKAMAENIKNWQASGIHSFIVINHCMKKNNTIL